MAVDARGAGPVDKSVGQRVRMRRITMQMSQTELAERVGITFQQIQKYEKGTNRIGASRLHRMSQVLEVPIAFFFEDVPAQKGRSGADPGLPDYLVELMGTSQGQRLVKGFARISDNEIRGNVVELVESIAQNLAVPEKKKRNRG
jgi:transcriptional regulator with XRE-family HTH domain